MKILHVMNDSVPLVGGYTTRSRSIVIHQKEIGMNPYVVTSVRQGATAENREEFDGILYYRTNWPEKCHLRNLKLLGLLKELSLFHDRILEVATEISPHIIHAHSPVLCAIPALFVARRLGIPVVYEIRAFWEDAAVASSKFGASSLQYRCIRTLETIVCRFVDRVAVISQAMKQDILNRRISRKKVFVAPNGVDASTFDALCIRDPELINQLGLGGKVVLGYLGTFYDFEGIDDLIRAFVRLNGQKQDIALLLIGGGEMENAIRDQVRSLNKPEIVLLGKVSPEKVPKYYALMDVVAYPRISTRITEMTTPLKPLEAMAFGKPVVCSDVGGLKELVGKDNALFFSSGNELELINCFKRLIDDPSLAARIAARGKHRALVEKNWSQLIGNYLPIYNIAETRDENERKVV